MMSRGSFGAVAGLEAAMMSTLGTSEEIKNGINSLRDGLRYRKMTR